MSEITHLTNVNASPQPHETVTGIETGIETGKEIETVIGGSLPVDDMDLRRRGRGIENERKIPPRGGRTRRRKRRRSHQSHCLQSSLGLSAHCPNRQGLMVGVNLISTVYHRC